MDRKRQQELEREALKSRVQKVLSRHTGRNNAIGMGALHETVFSQGYANKINGTRRLRHLINELRAEGVPICSTSGQNDGGYYLASAGSERAEYVDRLKRQALKKLALAAKIKRVTLPSLMGEIQGNLEVEEVEA